MRLVSRVFIVSLVYHKIDNHETTALYFTFGYPKNLQLPVFGSGGDTYAAAVCDDV